MQGLSRFSTDTQNENKITNKICIAEVELCRDVQEGSSNSAGSISVFLDKMQFAIHTILPKFLYMERIFEIKMSFLYKQCSNSGLFNFTILVLI